MCQRGTVTSAYEILRDQLGDLRPSIHNLDKILFPCGGPKPKTLIEISGCPGTGRTTLLAYIMARCLPPTYFDGKYSDVLFINLSHKFSIHKFREYIKCVINESKEECTQEECETILDKCLESVIVLDCYSAEEFHLSFETADNILLNNRYINLIALDGIDSFYWQDVRHSVMRMKTHYAKTMSRLRKLCENHSVCCAYTVDSNYLKSNGEVQNNEAQNCLKADYNLKLELENGTRTLNSKPFTINETGIHFE